MDILSGGQKKERNGSSGVDYLIIINECLALSKHKNLFNCLMFTLFVAWHS